MVAVGDAVGDAQRHLHGDGVGAVGGAVGEPCVGGAEEVLILQIEEPERKAKRQKQSETEMDGVMTAVRLGLWADVIIIP